MDRPSFDSVWINLALNLAERSTCSRLKVGSVLVSLDNRKVLALGYNGNTRGLKNECDRPTEKGNCGCLHAECGVVINNDNPRTVLSKLYVTHLPCINCTKMIINMGGVQEIIYKTDYDYKECFELLRQANIIIRQFDET